MKLDTPISEFPSVGPVYSQRLTKLGINCLQDLLLHIPHRYLDFSQLSKVINAKVDEIITVKGKMVSLKNQYSRRGLKMQIGSFEDESGKMLVVWFNQPFLIKTLYPGRSVSLSGKVGFFGAQKALISPEYEILGEATDTTHTGRIVPIYPETSGVSSKWLRHKIKTALKDIKIKETLPKEILKEESLMSVKKALEVIHFPKENDPINEARKRLAFDELLDLQVKSIKRKQNWQKNKSQFRLDPKQINKKPFIDSLPFKLTKSQKTAVDEIVSDMTKAYPMNRLLEGDVGSGKTVVAAIAAFETFLVGLQTVVMAPTQILARQHFNTLNSLFKKFKVRITLLTSATKDIPLGRADIFVGTHSLIHNKINFDRVGLVVIDEQHRFGVEQRAHLVKKSSKSGKIPHVLTMTATPIPRTIALTAYGDLDLSTLKEMPEGRQIITTWVVPQTKRKSAFGWIKKHIKNQNSQAFVICPLIEESEKEGMQEVKAVTKELTDLKKVFKAFKLEGLHGRMKAEEKNKILSKFKKGEIDILVSTPVVEVGIDMPNATIMVIEESERFGLAQLHQLRGRVGRGEKKSYCMLFAKKPTKRISAMTRNLNGFELAELDLKLRGPGEVFGKLQHGFVDLKIASWSNFDLIKKAKEVALKLLPVA
ncbi:ATP-dependent DNA helicase RecG [Patescibacteria group bacterium]